MSVYDRAGSAFTSGAPIGAAMNIGASTQTEDQAKTAGRLFGQAAAQQGGVSSYAMQNSAPVSNTPSAAAPAPAPHLGGVSSYATPGAQQVDSGPNAVVGAMGGWVLKQLHRPAEYLFNYLSASERYNSHGAYKSVTANNPLGFLGAALLDPGARDDWNKTVQAQASVFQTMERVHAGQGFGLLDDPAQREARDAYYSTAGMRWTLGVGDAALEIFADPLVVGGKIGAVARASRGVLGAGDVAKVADRSIEAVDLTSKQNQARRLVDTVVQHAQTILSKPGGESALANSAFFKQSSDAGAIPSMLKSIINDPNLVGNADAQAQAMRDVIHAGMGDIPAIQSLAEKSALLKSQMDSLSSSVSAYNNGAKLQDALEQSAWRDAASTLNDHWVGVNADPLVVEQLAAHQKLIEDEFAKIARVESISSPAGRLVEGQVTNRGELARLPQGENGFVDVLGGRFRSGSFAQRDLAHVVRVAQTGLFSPPVHMFSGLHLPTVFNLTAPDAPEIFDQALSRAAQAGMDRAQLATFADDFRSVVGNNPAITREGRATIVRQLEVAVEKHISDKYGVDLEQVSGFMSNLRALRSGELRGIGSHVHKAQPGKPAVMATPDGDILAFSPEFAARMNGPAEVNLAGAGDTPNLFGTTMQESISILDAKKIDSFMKRYSVGGKLGGFMKQTEKGWNLTKDGLDAVSHLWKFSALFRLGYAPRVQVDTQGRMLAKLGPMEWLSNAAKGMSNTVFNLQKVDRNVAEQLSRRALAHQQISMANWDLQSLSSEELLNPTPRVAALQAQIHAAKEVLAEAPVKVAGKKTTLRGTEMAKYLGKPQRIDRSGNMVGEFDPLATHQSTQGVERAIGSFDAQSNTIGMLTDGNGQALARVRGTGRWNLISGDKPEWYGSYTRAVNQQVRNDQVGIQILQGRTDQEIKTWMRDTAAGQEYWRTRDISWHGASAVGDDMSTWLAHVNQHIDTLLPTPEVKSLAATHNISQGDIDKMWTTPSERPQVPGEILNAKNPASAPAAIYEATAQKFFHVAAEMPENMMGRHPFYINRFQAHAQTMLDDTGLEKEALTIGDLNMIRKKADTLARRDIGKVMFDTSKESNLAYHARFVSPFYTAWADMMSKWSHILGTEFHVDALVANMFRAPNSAGLIVDDEGHKVDTNGDVHGKDGKVINHVDPLTGGNILISLPGFVKNWSGSDKVIIRKDATNIIFQGQPWYLPGPGPLATIPLNEVMLNTFPEFADSAVGQYATGGMGLVSGSNVAARAAKGFEPSWMNKLWDYTGGFNPLKSTAVGTAYVQEHQSIVSDIRNGKIPNMTPDEIDKMATQRARNQMLMRLLGSEAPVSTNPYGRLQYYTNKYRDYRAAYGLDAYDRFVNDFPEYKDMAISLTKNATGVNATEEAYRAALPYKTAIDRNPEFGWFFAGEQNLLGQFSQGVYTAQANQSDRNAMTPAQRIAQPNINDGWSQYTKISTELQDAVAARGLNSLQAKGAADLKQVRDDFVLALEKENPDWANAFHSRQSGDAAAKFLSYATDQVTQHPELGKRGDIIALGQYMQVRQALMGQMESRGIGSLVNSQGKATAGAEDLKAVWDEFTAGLVQQDLGFQQMWSRVLEGDRLATTPWGGDLSGNG